MARVDEERKYWDKAAKDSKIIYDDWLTQQTYETLHEFVEWGHPWAVFELGCGDGRLLNRLANSFPEKHFLGLDISPKMLELAKAKAPKNAHYSLSDGRSIGIKFADDSRKFNAAYCVTVFQHLPLDAVATYIKEVSNTLDPLGRFLVQFIEGTEDEPFSHHHTADMIDHLLDANGFLIKRHFEAVHPLWTWIEAVKQ